jgi:hypothetical protein
VVRADVLPVPVYTVIKADGDNDNKFKFLIYKNKIKIKMSSGRWVLCVCGELRCCAAVLRSLRPRERESWTKTTLK